MLNFVIMAKRYVIGDIHGAYKALIQVLNKVEFDYENDELIGLGDVCDGWPDTKECIDELLKIKNFVNLRGNHDEWALQFYKKEISDGSFRAWFPQGGQATLKSLGENPEDIDPKYLKFLEDAKLYHITDDNTKFFAHAGPPHRAIKLELADSYHLIWNRDKIQHAFNNKDRENGMMSDARWDEIYVGHTPTISFGNEYDTPQNWQNFWAMDTGGTRDGSLSIMNIDTKEFKQSTQCWMLYPEHRGRNELSFNEWKEQNPVLYKKWLLEKSNPLDED